MAQACTKSNTVLPACLLALGLVSAAATMAATAQTPSQARAERNLHRASGGFLTYSISGTVTDPSGAVLGGATVSVHRADGSMLTTLRCDRNGTFRGTPLPAGSYRLEVASPGFEPKSVTVAVDAKHASDALLIVLQIGNVTAAVDVQGREGDLTGIADSATQGVVGSNQLQSRPILRSGEILEAIPGVIITQHAGGGKANQYFLRGFNLDHGTDFAVFLDDMPLNLPSHAHGEGYSDMNTVIPEFVQRVSYEKGPYYAEVGNYGSAGSAHLGFFKSLPQNFVQVEGGRFGYGRLVLGASHKAGPGDLLVGAEAFHDDGPWTHPDNFYKFNGLLRYSQGREPNGFGLTARAYQGTWHSSDQIAANAVPLVGLFGTLDPTDGGASARYSVQGEWHHANAASHTTVAAYVFRYRLNLFSNFTYLLVDPVRGDQFEQQDNRWVTGLDARHANSSTWLGRRIENAVGVQIRNDWIHNGLFQSQDRRRLDKLDPQTGTTLPATTQEDRFTDTQVGFYAENRVQWAPKIRSVLGVRGDIQLFQVTSLVTAANSGNSLKALPSPKASLIFGPWLRTEFYAQAGFSFHSNDGRGTTLTVEPVSGENPFPHTPATPIPPLIPTKGGELGIRSTAVRDLQSTLSVWYLHSASELQQSGDTGGTVASAQPSERYGFEWANFYTPLRNLSFDVDLANSRALFTQTDADDAAPDSPGGKRVPEAVGWVVASGVTVQHLKGFTGSLRLRNFGPRDLTSDGLYRSRATVLLNAEAGYAFAEKWSLSAELLNLLNREDHDIDYAYESRVTPSAASAFTDVFHPVEPFQLRVWLRRSF